MKIVVSDDCNERIDSYLSQNEELDLTRAKIQSLIKSKNILVNGKEVKSSYKVQTGDEIDITIVEENLDVEAEDIPLDIVYEDDDVIVVNKPSGMVVHPSLGNTSGTLVNALMNHSKLSSVNGEFRPGIVHRIDKDTSGLLIIAKNDKAHINLSEQIKNREITKKYIALVRGVVKENCATIDMPIGRSDKDRKKMAVRKDGKNAVTHFNVIKRYNGYTLLDVKIDTGRTHQIRVHLSEIGYPIVGDFVYSNGKNPFGVEGQMLHAKSLEFKHPITGKEMKLEAPLPEYFEEVLNKL